MLKFIKKTKREFHHKLQAVDILYQKMSAYNREAKEILSFMIEQARLKNDHPKLNSLMKMMVKFDDTVIDCATKLAPYQAPKLANIEIKSKVEHKFVIRAPSPISSVEEWQRITGAEQMKLNNQTKKEIKRTTLAPSIHDYDEEEDELNTQRELLN